MQITKGNRALIVTHTYKGFYHYMTQIGGRHSIFRLVGKGARRVKCQIITIRDYHREKLTICWEKLQVRKSILDRLEFG